MNYKIIRTDEYLKKLKKFIKNHPDILDQYIKTIELLEVNLFDIGTHDAVY
jgi:mRNA-degrading endonuclease RelE of RelBE toxin-antitoxin system